MTTPAGLYLLTYPLSRISRCDTPYLRAFNSVGISVLTPILVYRIHQALHGKSSANSFIAAQTALNIAIFPLLFFFAGLYYTDVYSTVFVLAAYLALLERKPRISAIYCWVSLWFRQTNILWTAFFAGLWIVEKVPELEEDKDVNKTQAVPANWSEIILHNPIFSSETTVRGMLVSRFPRRIYRLIVVNRFHSYTSFTYPIHLPASSDTRGISSTLFFRVFIFFTFLGVKFLDYCSW